MNLVPISSTHHFRGLDTGHLPLFVLQYLGLYNISDLDFVPSVFISSLFLDLCVS